MYTFVALPLEARIAIPCDPCRVDPLRSCRLPGVPWTHRARGLRRRGGVSQSGLEGVTAGVTSGHVTGVIGSLLTLEALELFNSYVDPRTRNVKVWNHPTPGFLRDVAVTDGRDLELLD